MTGRPSLALSKALGQWIDTLYRQAQRPGEHSFKHWCFDAVGKLLEFDSGIWASRSDLTKMRHEHWVEDTCLYRQDESFMANYAKVAEQSAASDLLNQFLAQNPGRFYAIWDCCDKQSWYKTDFYVDHCVKFGIENAISVIMPPTDNSAVYHVLSFYRKDKHNEFSPDDILLANFILPNLIEAFRINVLSTFSQTQDKGRSHRAVLDRYGALLESESGFNPLMQSHDLLQGTTVVGVPGLSGISAPLDVQLEDLQFDIDFDDGLLYLEVRESSPVIRLSIRERQIADLLPSGLSSQSIAELLSEAMPNQPIKTSTVNAHLRNIYKKLDVKTRAAAAALLVAQVKEEKS